MNLDEVRLLVDEVKDVSALDDSQFIIIGSCALNVDDLFKVAL